MVEMGEDRGRAAGRTLLVTAANGMFGGALVAALAGDERVQVRAMVRDAARFTLRAPNVQVVVADMDKPETLLAAVEGATHVFVTTPMDDRIAAREEAVVDACVAAGSPHVLKVFGAVRHEGDDLAGQHGAALQHLKESGLPWTLVSPNSVMETSLYQYAETLKFGCLVGISGHGRVGLVALDDVIAATRAIVTGRVDDAVGRNCELTGPAAVDLYDVAAAFSAVLGRPIAYYDEPEDEFKKQLMEHSPGMTDEQAEYGVMEHLRAWRAGKADLVTGTVQELTGRSPTSIKDWIAAHKERFDLRRSVSDHLVGTMLRMRHGHAETQD